MTIISLYKPGIIAQVRGSVPLWVRTCLGAALVFAAALVTRTGILGLPPIYDELYHILPAMSWRESGTFAVLDGSYDRGAIYTRLVALGFTLAGEQSTAAARLLPSAIPGALLVTVMFLWVRSVADSWAVAITLVLLLFWPNGIEVSQYVRFYAVQGLAFVLAALAVYAAATGTMTRGRRLGLLAIAVPLLAFAVKLQLTTVIAAGAIALWVALLFGPGWLGRHVWLRWALLGALVLVLGLLLSGVMSDHLRAYWTLYRWEPWPVQRDTTFYHRDFRDNYPTFWPLFPVAALVALRARFVPVSFGLTLFSVCFVLHSFGGLKNIRYLYPEMPFFFAIWGIALSHLGRRMLTFLREQVAAILPGRWSPQLRPLATTALLGIAGLFLVGSNVGLVRGLQLAMGTKTDMLLGKPRWEWPNAAALVEPWLRKGAVVITTEELQAVQWLGDYDFAFNRPRFSEMLFSLGPDTQPFVRDFRNGRPIAGLTEDFLPVIACAPVGLVISNTGWSEGPDARALARMAVATGATTRTDVEGQLSMLAWQRGDAPADEEAMRACLAASGIALPGAAGHILSGARQPRSVSSARAER